MDTETRMIKQLDADQPNWWCTWATGQELEAYAKGADRPLSGEALPADPREILKRLIARRLFHRILNAALAAGVVREAE